MHFHLNISSSFKVVKSVTHWLFKVHSSLISNLQLVLWFNFAYHSFWQMVKESQSKFIMMILGIINV